MENVLWMLRKPDTSATPGICFCFVCIALYWDSSASPSSYYFSYIMEYGGYIEEQVDETNSIQEEMVLSFTEITENKSGQTGQHIKRVSEYLRKHRTATWSGPGAGREHTDRLHHARYWQTVHPLGNSGKARKVDRRGILDHQNTNQSRWSTAGKCRGRENAFVEDHRPSAPRAL